MMNFIILLFSTTSFASSLPPSPFPVFLKEGFSSVLEFEESPSRVVLGDSQSFQVERLGKSIVIKPLTPYAVTNMFVYFVKEETRLFILTASEDAEPTYFKKFESPIKIPTAPAKPAGPIVRGLKVVKIDRDTKNDYLTADITVGADSKSAIRPNWDKTVLKNGSKVIVPSKVWAERKEVSKDTVVKARFVFAKPNVAKNLKGVTLVVPMVGNQNPMTADLSRYVR